MDVMFFRGWSSCARLIVLVLEDLIIGCGMWYCGWERFKSRILGSGVNGAGALGILQPDLRFYVVAGQFHVKLQGCEFCDIRLVDN